jgi:predicted double-glycine peptidase
MQNTAVAENKAQGRKISHRALNVLENEAVYIDARSEASTDVLRD